jgi:hypothetical protein
MTTIDTGGIPVPPSNKYTRDAEERMTRLRAMAAEFPDEADPKLLTTSEMRLARGTSLAALENAAVFVQAMPNVGRPIADAEELREAIAFELAYGGVRDEARALAHRIDKAILRRKLKAVRAARGVYRVAKGFATIDGGEAIHTHVSDMKRSIVGRRRTRKPAAAPPPPADTAATK